jgi:hypothetical protein
MFRFYSIFSELNKGTIRITEWVNHWTTRSAMLLLIVAYTISSITLAYSRVDAGYFLSIPRDMVQLKLNPIADIHSVYTPIGYYFYSIVFSMFDSPPIEYFYFFNFLITILSATIFYQALKLNSSNTEAAWLSMLLLIIVNPLVYDIKLEIFVIFFGSLAFLFLSIYLLSNSPTYLLATGVFLSLATLSKQYALILLPAFFIIVWVKTSFFKTVKTFFYLSGGFALGIFCYFLIFIVLGANVQGIYNQFIGKFEYNCFSDYGVRQIENIVSGFKYWLIKMPFFLLALPLLLKQFKQNILLFFLFFILTVLYAMPFYFQAFPHYFYFGFLPLFIISIPIIKNHKTNLFLKTMFFAPVFMFIYSTYILIRDLEIRYEKKKHYNEFYSELSKHIQPYSKGFIENHKQIYFESKIISIDLKNLSYSFGPVDCLLEACNKLQDTPTSFYFITSNPDTLSIDGYRLNSINKVNNKVENRYYNVYNFIK